MDRAEILAVLEPFAAFEETLREWCTGGRSWPLQEEWPKHQPVLRRMRPIDDETMQRREIYRSDFEAARALRDQLAAPEGGPVAEPGLVRRWSPAKGCWVYDDVSPLKRIADDMRAGTAVFVNATPEPTVSADEINVILSEDARVENGALANPEYLAVKIASAIERRVTTLLAHPDAGKEEREAVEEVDHAFRTARLKAAIAKRARERGRAFTATEYVENLFFGVSAIGEAERLSDADKDSIRARLNSDLERRRALKFHVGTPNYDLRAGAIGALEALLEAIEPWLAHRFDDDRAIAAIAERSDHLPAQKETT